MKISSIDYAYAQQPELKHMPRIFIVEGPDATGKTTLAKALAIRLNAAYFHTTARGALKVAQADYMRNILNSVKVCNQFSGIDVVLDRHWPSEVCYGPVIRPPERPIVCDGVIACNLPPFPSQEFFSEFAMLKADYIFCLSDEALARHAVHKDPDHAYSDDQYVAVYQNYVKLFVSMLNSHERVFAYSIEKNGQDIDKYLDYVLNTK